VSARQHLVPEDLQDDAGWRHNEYFAEGVRNTVGLTEPRHTAASGSPTMAGMKWATIFHRMSLNKARVDGQHFGFPYVHGNNILDPGVLAQTAKE